MNRPGSPAAARTAGPTATFTLSLDLELLWGTLDLFGPERFRRACEMERGLVIDRLLAMLEEHEIPATWCIVGHLFLDHCQPQGGQVHPEIVRPRHRWARGDWFRHDPCSTEAQAPLFYGRSLVERILACRVPQEIGLHSFSHVIFSDAGCSRETAASEIGASLSAARGLGFTPRTFAFPRNGIGHLDVLAEHGIGCFRGPAPRWYERWERPRGLVRAARLVSVLTAATPPVVKPQPGPGSLWNIPASMLYFPNHGLRRHVPVARRVRRAIKGLDAAAQQGKVFHLWFHPTNLANDPDAMFGGLDAIFTHARALRRQGKLTIAPMAAIVQRAGVVG